MPLSGQKFRQVSIRGRAYTCAEKEESAARKQQKQQSSFFYLSLSNRVLPGVPADLFDLFVRVKYYFQVALGNQTVLFARVTAFKTPDIAGFDPHDRLRVYQRR